jgi:hypothetical protein
MAAQLKRQQEEDDSDGEEPLESDTFVPTRHVQGTHMKKEPVIQMQKPPQPSPMNAVSNKKPAAAP